MTRKTLPSRVFCFWEPVGQMPAYLSLCMETWTPALRGSELVLLDYSSLDDYVPRGTYDMTAFRRLSVVMQRDAISVAVLHRHGGVFLDVDTLLFGDITTILERLQRTELILFNRHLAFLASTPGVVQGPVETRRAGTRVPAIEVAPVHAWEVTFPLRHGSRSGHRALLRTRGGDRELLQFAILAR